MVSTFASTSPAAVAADADAQAYYTLMERASSRIDKSTQATLESFAFKHLNLGLTVDFEAKTLSGRATWTVLMTSASRELVVDTSAGLTVREAFVCGVRVEHIMRPPHSVFGVAWNCMPAPNTRRLPIVTNLSHRC